MRFLFSIISSFFLATLAFSGLAGANAIELSAKLDHPVIMRGEATSLYALLRLDALTAPERGEDERPPLNISLVMDRSGSMGDAGKLTYAQKAAKDLVDRLSADDRLSVVSYSDYVTVEHRSSKLDNRPAIKRKINRLFPDGWTNVSGGLETGSKEVARHLSSEGINRILLLSDGIANRGIESEEGIRRFATDLRAKGVTVTALGLGADYNEDFMTTIAKAGAGNYYFIESPSQMAYIFDREIRTLFSTVARDAELRFVPSEIINSARVTSVEKDSEMKVSVLPLGDFHSGEDRGLLLRLDIDAPLYSGTLNLGTLQLSFVDSQTSLRSLAEISLTVDVTTDQSLVKTSVNEDVLVENSLIQAGKRQRKAADLYQQGEYKEAKKILKEARTGLLKLGGTLSTENDQLINQVEALEVEEEQYDEAEAAPAAVQSLIVKGAKNRAYQSGKGKKNIYLLKPGAAGFEVENLQRALKAQNLYDGDINGNFDDEVSSALKDYQNEQGLKSDGLAGPRTLKSLGLY